MASDPSEVSWWSKPRQYALWSSAIALLLALGTGILALVTGETAPYSPEVAVLTATLVAVVWYTAFTNETLQYGRERDQRELRRASASLATAVLSELRWLFSVLNGFARGEGLHAEVTTPVLNAALQQATLFTPDTTDRLAHVVTAVRRLKEELDAGPRSGGDLRRISAAAVCIVISDLVPHLVSEGGQLPRTLEQEPIAAADIPEVLPPDPFRSATAAA